MMKHELSRRDLAAFLADWGHGPEDLAPALQSLGWGDRQAFTEANLRVLGGVMTRLVLERLAQVPPSPQRDHLQALQEAMRAHALPLAKSPEA